MLIGLVATGLIILTLLWLHFWLGQYRASTEKVTVFRFSWGGQNVEVASFALVEWLALRQLLGEEWPPVSDLLRARLMIGQPTTEEELREEVALNLDRVKRAHERGSLALDLASLQFPEPQDH